MWVTSCTKHSPRYNSTTESAAAAATTAGWRLIAAMANAHQPKKPVRMRSVQKMDALGLCKSATARCALRSNVSWRLLSWTCILHYRPLRARGVATSGYRHLQYYSITDQILAVGDRSSLH